jgi:hypothetical protein
MISRWQSFAIKPSNVTVGGYVFVTEAKQSVDIMNGWAIDNQVIVTWPKEINDAGN